ncbi:MAG TPA: glutaminyl-peptide cyclotransferase, partial [Thermomicrobiales bacterium]|nr:glutaminyl-peptide cyclotransferase [Thermomicrobiales bacterium]
LDFTLDEPIDAFTVEAIETVVQEWAACTNAGDQLRAYTLLTDDYAQQGPVGASRDEARTMLATSPVPVSPEAAVSVGSAHDARVFPDGQAGATFATIGVRDPGEALTVFMLFEQPDGRWRIDGMTGVVAPAPTAPVWDYRVVAEYPHDTGAYTQGLVISDGQLFEGTGQWEESELRRVDLETGEVLQSHPLDPELFGEGIVVLADRIYQLTWQAGICFVYDRETFELLETFTYSGEGWGLTTDGERLIMSDGGSRLVFRDPDTFAVLNSVIVQDGGLPVSYLNELEYIDGEVWANIWQTDHIVHIDPATGNVTGWIDLTGLLPSDYPRAEDAEVLNGIAYDSETGRVFVTGKYWPAVFEIELVPPE